MPRDAKPEEIARKVRAGERLTLDDGVALFETPDLHLLGSLANEVREKRHGDRTFYVKNLHLNYTNVCVHTCAFCSGGFARREGEDGAWTMSVDDVVSYAEKGGVERLNEIHVVGGVHPRLPFAYYTEMLRRLKARWPHLHLKAFTAVEIEHLARLAKKPVEQALAELREAGLDSMPGGGAEIFARRVWDDLCGTKTRPEKWLDIHRTAHRLGIRSTCTMLYGHMETAEERVDHMLRLRALQDETGGFTAFIPLAFQPENNLMKYQPRPTAVTDLRVHAVARLLLDNIDHVKAYWVMTGLKMAQLLQWYGADDVDGTIVAERVVHMSGADSPPGLTEEELCRVVREAGRTPVLRDTLYNVLAVK